MRRLRELGVLVVVAALWSCDAGDPTTPALRGPLAPDQEVGATLQALQRKPVKEGGLVPQWHGHLGRTAVAWVGPNGGELAVAGVRLTIPAGALSRPRLVAVYVPRSDAVQAVLLPHGLEFGRSAELSFSLEGTEADGDPGVASSLKGVYFIVPIRDGTVTVEEVVPSRLESDHIVLTIDHFSGYTPAGG